MGELRAAAEMPRSVCDGAQALERLRALPGGELLLSLAAEREDVELVGGAVRDLLLGQAPRELDVVLDGSPGSFSHAAALFARDLAERIDLRSATGAQERCEVSIHERFGTAVLRWGEGRIDVAARRAESYAHPGALPEVRPGTPEEDLLRRDFAVNAVALALSGPRRGLLREADGALEDLRAGRLRVLHELSFIDDPTRLLRLARYAARLGFVVERDTQRLALEAVAAGALRTVSGARIGAELRLAAAEADPVASFAQMAALRALIGIDPRLELDERLLADALALLPQDGRPDLLAVASLLLPIAHEEPLPALTAQDLDADEWGDADARIGESRRIEFSGEPRDPRDQLLEMLDLWEYPGNDRRPMVEAAMYASFLASEMPLADSPSELWDLLHGTAVEAVALAGAFGSCSGDGAAPAAARSWIEQIRHVRLLITGDDLLAAGLSPGPEIGARLEEVLCLRLDGMIAEGRDAELSAALEA